MPVENAQYINQLQKDSPQGGESISEGDDHLRAIKTAVTQSFPNVNAPVTATPSDLNSVGNLISDVNDLKNQISSIGVGTTKNLFAAVTYDGYRTVGTTNNVTSVDWVDQGNGWKFARVNFASPVRSASTRQNGTLDANINIQVTAFSNANNSLGFAGFAFPTITEIYPTHVEIAFQQSDLSGQFQAVWNMAFCLMVAEND